MLEVGDRLRHHRPRDCEPLSGFGHVAVLGHSHEDVQVTRLEPTPNTVSPVHLHLVAKQLLPWRNLELVATGKSDRVAMYFEQRPLQGGRHDCKANCLAGLLSCGFGPEREMRDDSTIVSTAHDNADRALGRGRSRGCTLSPGRGEAPKCHGTAGHYREPPRRRRQHWRGGDRQSCWRWPHAPLRTVDHLHQSLALFETAFRSARI